jgi:HEAT repeat protein
VTEKNRRGRGVLAGLLGTGSENGDQDPQPPADNGATQRSEGRPESAPGKGDAGFSQPDVPAREAYEPGWYRVLASEPAEHSVREDPKPPADDDAEEARYSAPVDPALGNGEALRSEPANDEPTITFEPVNPFQHADPPPANIEPSNSTSSDNEPANFEQLIPLVVDSTEPAEYTPHVDSEPVFVEPLSSGPADSFEQTVPLEPSGYVAPAAPETSDFEELLGLEPLTLQPLDPSEPADSTEPESPEPPSPSDHVNDPEPPYVEPVHSQPSDPGPADPAPKDPAPNIEPPPAEPSVGAAPVEGLEAPEANASSGFLSLDAAERRAALMEVASRGLMNEDVEMVSRLVSDPERDIRVFAVQTLQTRPDAVPAGVVRRALTDPTDEVRSEAVGLEAARSDPDLIELASLVAGRRWPLTQQAAFQVLPVLIGRHQDPSGAADAILLAVAEMDSSPVDEERDGFLALVRALGRSRLVEALDLPDERRLGATRLLIEDGSDDALRAVARLTDDAAEEIRMAAESARDQLAVDEPEPTTEPASVEPALDTTSSAPEPPSAPEQEPPSEPETAPAPEAEDIISALAKALEDPDERVRERGARELGETNRGSLLEWTRAGLASRDHHQVATAAGVAEAAGLTEVAAEILGCAAALRPEERGPLVGALASFGLDPAELVTVAGDVDANNRPDAIRLLWQVSGRGVLPALRNLLADSSGPVRVAVLDVFGDSGDPSAIEVAHGVLETDSSPIVRATAIRVIGRAGLDQRTSSLSEALDDPDPDVRATAVELLPHGLAGQAGELLLKALSDEDDRVWQPAMRHLVSLPERDLPVLWRAIKEAPADRRDALISLLERTSRERLGLVASDHLSSSDEDDRMLAISLAARSGSPEAMQGVIGTLADPQPTVRRAGAAALAELRDHEAIPALTQALNDPDAEVREGALRALSALDDEQVLEPLINGLKDPEERVRQVASDALIRWNSPAVARRLVEALTSPALRRPAIEVLARMGPAAVDPLVNLLREGHPELAATVGVTLEQLVGRDVFLSRLGSMDPADRLGAVEALGAMGGPEAVDGLTRALSDPNEQIRISALRALGDMRDPSAVDAVRRSAEGDPMPEVAAAAEEALRKLLS